MDWMEHCLLFCSYTVPFALKHLKPESNRFLFVVSVCNTSVWRWVFTLSALTTYLFVKGISLSSATFNQLWQACTRWRGCWAYWWYSSAEWWGKGAEELLYQDKEVRYWKNNVHIPIIDHHCMPNWPFWRPNPNVWDVMPPLKSKKEVDGKTRMGCHMYNCQFICDSDSLCPLLVTR